MAFNNEFVEDFNNEFVDVEDFNNEFVDVEDFNNEFVDVEDFNNEFVEDFNNEFVKDTKRMVSFSSSFSSLVNTSFPHKSIYSIPSSLRRGNERAYTPRILSIGLISHRRLDVTEETIKMGTYKKIYASRLLRRAGPLEETIELCTNAMLKVADQVIMCYPGRDSFNSDHQYESAQTMLRDGCFILELVLSWWTRSWDKEFIIHNRSTLNDIIHDLLLLENQIPFFVLEELFKLTIQRIPQDENSDHPPLRSLSLEKLILNFIFCPSHFKTFNIPSGPPSGETSVVEVEHILGLVHSCYRPHKSEPGDYMIDRFSATEILRARINLKPSRNEEVNLDVCFNTPCLFSWFPNITTIFLLPWWIAIFIYNTIFCSSTPTVSEKLPVSIPAAPTASTELPLSMSAHEGHAASPSCCWLSFICQLCRRATLEMPQLWITDSTESFLRNQIAYEQFSQNIPHYFTSYAFLMDTIINTKEHIEMLETSGVLKNYLGSSKVAANLFNSLCSNVVLGDKFYFSGQWKQVNAYYNLSWPSFLGSLGATYFSSPWTGISLFAAVVLFIFTGLQTACTVIQTWYSK